LTVHSRHAKCFVHNKKGYAGIIASVFLVLVVLYLYYNVFSVTQNRNVAFQDAASQSQQLDLDRSMELVAISDVTYSVGRLSLIAKNIGAIPVQLVRIWAQNLETGYVTFSFSPPIILHSGDEVPLSFQIGINGAENEILFWFVTARGNLLPVNNS